MLTESIDVDSVTAYGEGMTVRRPLQLALVLLVAAFTLSMGTAAGAVENPDYTAPPPSTPVTDPPTQVATLRANRAAASPVAAAAPSNQRLAITGSETAQLLVIGALLVAGGATLMAVRRRTASA